MTVYSLFGHFRLYGFMNFGGRRSAKYSPLTLALLSLLLESDMLPKAFS